MRGKFWRRAAISSCGGAGSQSTKASVVSDDETDAEFVPQLRGLQVEIEKPKTFTIGSLAGQNTPPDYKGKGTYDLNDFTSKP